MLSDAQRKIFYKFPDELAFALAQYIYSLEPPPNPNLGDARAAGQQSSTEDWFNPARVRDDFVPSGFKGYSGGQRSADRVPQDAVSARP